MLNVKVLENAILRMVCSHVADGKSVSNPIACTLEGTISELIPLIFCENLQLTTAPCHICKLFFK